MLRPWQRVRAGERPGIPIPWLISSDRYDRCVCPGTLGSTPPGATVNVVARCNDREFYLPATEDFIVLLTHLREMARTYEITLYAYTMVPNHVHLPLQAPKLDALGRPLRWFMTGTS